MKYNWILAKGQTSCTHGVDESNFCEKCYEHFEQTRFDRYKKISEEISHDGEVDSN